jgi:U3 small nucleolar RNA-associated protein 11
MSERALKRFLKHRDKKERGQLTHRKHLGLLEKKKDYKVRSSDYRKKRDRIRLLQSKAELRNEDEYNSGMLQNVVDSNGNVITTQQKHRSSERMKRDKEVDVSFLKQKIKIRKKHLEQQKNQLAALDHLDTAKRTHVVFVDDEDQFKNWKAHEHFNTLPELMKRSHNRLTVDQLEDDIILNKVTPGLLKRADKAKALAYQEIRDDEKVLREMEKAEKKATLQRNLMAGGRYTKIIKKDIFGDEIKSKTRYKWKEERRK